MSRRHSQCRICALALLTISLASCCVVAQTNIDPVEKWAWGTNIGWINFAPEHGGVVVYRDHLEGYAWGENVGWIRMGTHEDGGAHEYENTAPDNYGVNRAPDGTLSGYAWGTNVGWINFAPEHGGVRIEPSTHRFVGYAWGENVGWIRFTDDNYSVLFTGFPPQGQPGSGSGSNLAPKPNAGPDQVVKVGQRAVLDGSRSHDGEDPAPASIRTAASTDGLSFRWAFAIRYMAAGVPVYAIPEGSDCFDTCEGFDSPIASFIPDVEGEYTLNLYVTDAEGECMSDQVLVIAVFDPSFVPEPPGSAEFRFERIVCRPNPFSSEIVFDVVGEGTPDSLSVMIFALSGQLVWHGSADGRSSLIWSGTASLGARLPNGGYICVLTVAGGGEVRSEKTIVFIRR